MLDLILAPLVGALVIQALNAYFGLHVLRREVIFVDLAFAQVAALGGTVGILFHVEPGTGTAFLFTFGATLIGALIFSFTRLGESSPVPQEALIGTTYVVASAAVILLASLTAEGAEHISETLTGSLIWVTWPTVVKIAIVYALIGVFHYVFRRKMLDITFHPERVSRLRLWDFIFYLTFGIAIAMVVNLAGVLFLFSTLVIPAVIALFFAQSFGATLLLAWLSGAASILIGLIASFYWDMATGPTLVCAFGVVLIVAGVIRMGANLGGRKSSAASRDRAPDPSPSVPAGS